MMQLRIAGTVENSIVDGEGIRYTIFVQDVRMDVRAVTIRRPMIFRAES